MNIFTYGGSGNLYNAIFPIHPEANKALKALNLNRESFDRFRNAWVRDNKIVVYTRMGQMRNHELTSEIQEGLLCMCRGCRFTYSLSKHINFIEIKNDTYDETYCAVYFTIPDTYREEFAELAKLPPIDTGVEWKKKMKEITSDPEKMMSIASDLGLDKIFNQLKD